MNTSEKNNSFALSLETAIQRGLPGIEYQWVMASTRIINDPPLKPGRGTREAAVLILLFPHDGSIHTVFMQRPDYEGFHAGQISFPGGKKEPDDTDLIRTAIREADEETGVDPQNIKVIGTLTPLFIPVSNIVVTSVVAWNDSKPSFRPSPEEVVFLIDADLGKFLEPSIVKTKQIDVRGEKLDIRYFNYEEHIIWGATAMILNELIEIIKRDNLSLSTNQ